MEKKHTVICVSCGTPTESDAITKYNYCERCERERNDESLRPKVWEYIGGNLGSLPNKRGETDYSLLSLGFNQVGTRETPNGTIPLYVREHDGRLMGLVALKTLDDYVVIVGGREEYENLFAESADFATNPIVTNLPKQISSPHQSNFDIAMQAKRDAGLEE